MAKTSSLNNKFAIYVVAMLVLCDSFGTSYAREGKQWRKMAKAHGGSHHQHHHQHHRQTHGVVPKMNGKGFLTVEGSMAVAKLASSAGTSSTFNVLNYGAKGDGKSNDREAFNEAWKAACETAGSTIMVPSGFVFLLEPPISFPGPCQPNIVFQLDGKIIAPTSSQAWRSGLLQWIEFRKLQKITIKGKGVIDGKGSVWWNDIPTYNPADASETVPSATPVSANSSNALVTTELSKMPSTKPTALRFYGSTGVTVTGITIVDSPQTHLKFDSCNGVQVYGFTASSPGDSPNTDGIHLQNSQSVTIYNTDLACGDDCVSIQTGCSDVYIHDVKCGPGHGISIGGLGKDNTKACVSNVTVRDTTMTETKNGVRIKTWQGGSGSVQNIMFSNIQVSKVKTPIMIDQFYCDNAKCKNETSAVAVSGINYINIKGTYTEQPVYFACSDSLPCMGVSLTGIELKAVDEGYHLYDPLCWETYGELKTAAVPPIECLQKGKPSNFPAQLDC